MIQILYCVWAKKWLDLHHQGNDGGIKDLLNAGKLLPDYKANNPEETSSNFNLFKR